MKRFILLFLIFSVVLFSNSQAQTTKKKKKPKAQPKTEKPLEIPLPPRSSDCFFAMNLMLDSTFGPTEPLQGFGFVNEIHPDAQTKNVFESEHNSVWYKIDCPYSGKLIIDIKPKSETDDYDFLVYKYTDRYFCNRVERNRVKPVRSIMSGVNASEKGATGLSLSGTSANISKSSTEVFGRYIDVQQGESYILVLDNLQDGGLGHSIRAEIYTEHKPLFIQIVDSVAKQRMTANIRVKETDSDREVLNLNETGHTKIKLLPNRSYDIYITKNGYFNYYKHVSYDDYATRKDSILTARLTEIKVGSVIPMKEDLYFDTDDKDSLVVMPDSYYILDDIAKILAEYPHLKVDIIGRVSTEGLNLKKDSEISYQRANAIKKYLVEKGISEDNISIRGTTNKEFLKQLDEQNKRNHTIFPRCEIKIRSVK